MVWAAIMNYVIVGNSAAGIAAAVSIRACDPNGCITIFSDEKGYGYARIFLPYLIAGKIDARTLFNRTAKWYIDRGINLYHSNRVASIDRETCTVFTVNGKNVKYDKLLIATGARPKKAAIKGDKLEGVTSLRDYNDAVKINDMVRPGMNAVILGGGLVGLLVAEALLKRNVKIVMAVFSDHILSRQLDPESASRMAVAAKNHGATILFQTNAIKIIDRGDGAVGGVDFGPSIGTIDADLVVVAKGVKPAIELAQEAKLQIDQGILVNDYLETTCENIYAAGDVAQARSLGSGFQVLPIWPVAVNQGKVAGWNMAIRNSTRRSMREEAICYQGGIQVNIAQCFGLNIMAAGKVNTRKADSEVICQSSTAYRKVILRNGRIVGALDISDLRCSGIAYWAVRNGLEDSLQGDCIEPVDIKQLEQDLASGWISLSRSFRLK